MCILQYTAVWEPAFGLRVFLSFFLSSSSFLPFHFGVWYVAFDFVSLFELL
jgi:hypothetical protein